MQYIVIRIYVPALFTMHTISHISTFLQHTVPVFYCIGPTGRHRKRKTTLEIFRQCSYYIGKSFPMQSRVQRFTGNLSVQFLSYGLSQCWILDFNKNVTAKFPFLERTKPRE